MLARKDRFIKRAFDITSSVILLSLIWWLFLIVWLISSIVHKSNGFFFQDRIGLHGKKIKVIKFKTMREGSGLLTTITVSNDYRITKLGKFLRRCKLDELPQIINVIKGDMSVVGPRPDVPGYADKLTGEDGVVVSVRPGITGPAQLFYRKEEEILSDQKNPAKYNDEVIWPNKVKINRQYVNNYTFSRDMYYIWKTFVGGDVKY